MIHIFFRRRYGCTSATKLSNPPSSSSCLDRPTSTAYNTRNIDNHHNHIMLYENRWEPPLIAAPHGVTIGKLGGGGHYASSPKLWPSETSNWKQSPSKLSPKTIRSEHVSDMSSNDDDDDESVHTTVWKEQNDDNIMMTNQPLSHRTDPVSRLSRVINREAKIWNQVAEGMDREKRTKTKKNNNSFFIQRNKEFVKYPTSSSSQDLRYQRMGMPNPKSNRKVFVLS